MRKIFSLLFMLFAAVSLMAATSHVKSVTANALALFILLGRYSCELFEEAGEVLGILEAELVGHLRDALCRVEEHLLAEREDMLLDVDLRRQPRLLADEVAEIAG